MSGPNIWPLLLAYLERPELDCPVYGGGEEQMGEI
jgi:hypothetical protein